MDFRGQAEKDIIPSKCDGARLSVNKGQHMSVCVKRAYLLRQAGWHRRLLVHPVPADSYYLGWDFFISRIFTQALIEF